METVEEQRQAGKYLLESAGQLADAVADPRAYSRELWCESPLEIASECPCTSVREFTSLEKITAKGAKVKSRLLHKSR